MKEQFTAYLEPDLMQALTQYAERRDKPKSLVAEAAIAAFLSPDAAERQEATLARRLDRITRQMERLERDVGISVETVALFIRFPGSARPAKLSRAGHRSCKAALSASVRSSRSSVGGCEHFPARNCWTAKGRFFAASGLTLGCVLAWNWMFRE
jgi:predicted transcriptional regulator